MRHDTDLWIQWRAEILAVVFLFHCHSVFLLDTICLDAFLERGLDFGRMDIEMLADNVINIA